MSPVRDESSLSFTRQRLATHVATYIRDVVVSGGIEPGQKLLIASLAEEIGVSTTPVREALLLLETEGLVKSQPRKGFFVVPLLANDLRDLFELHAVIAGKLAERATNNLTDEQVAELVNLDKRIKEIAGVGNGQEVEVLNFQFHRQINHAASSPMLTRFLAQTSRYVPRRFYAGIPGWTEASASEHEAILEALRRRDGLAVRIHMEEHIQRAGELLAAHLHGHEGIGQSAPAGHHAQPTTPGRAAEHAAI